MVGAVSASRPFRLRTLLDLELTEEEWGLISQAHLPTPPLERRLFLLVVDLSDDGPGLEEPLATLEAVPARLELRAGIRFFEGGSP